MGLFGSEKMDADTMRQGGGIEPFYFYWTVKWI